MRPDVLALLTVLQTPAVPGDATSHLAIPMHPRVHVEYALTGTVGTPSAIPFDINLPTLATAQLPIVEPIVDLLDTAGAHVHAMAFLPGDTAADEIVERLKRSKRAEQKQPLTRRA